MSLPHDRYLPISFNCFRARTVIFVEAGLAGTSINSPGLNGLGTPVRAGLAGTCFRSILTSPGIVNEPGPSRLVPISSLGRVEDGAHLPLGQLRLFPNRGEDFRLRRGLLGSVWGHGSTCPY